MVNNYTKSGLVPRAAARSTTGSTWLTSPSSALLKQVMSPRDMDLLIRQELQGDERSVADGYRPPFCESLDGAPVHRRRDGRYEGTDTIWRTPLFTLVC